MSEMPSDDIEFRDPNTQEIFLRASYNKACKHLRKISKIMKSEEHKNTNNIQIEDS